MAPIVGSEDYAKDLSKDPSLSGGFFDSLKHEFILPDETLIYRIVERTYEKADYEKIAIVYELAFESPAFIEEHINELRESSLSDDEIIRQVMSFQMENEERSIIVARFAYDSFNFIDHFQQQASGVQIRGAYVSPEKSGVGLAGQIYRQFALLYGHLVCDNTQTEFGAALWAGTVRDVVGRVDIYDCSAQQYVEELGDLATGIKGYIPWSLATAATINPNSLKMSLWKRYPFEIKSCHHIVLIVSR